MERKRGTQSLTIRVARTTTEEDGLGGYCPKHVWNVGYKCLGTWVRMNALFGNKSLEIVKYNQIHTKIKIILSRHFNVMELWRVFLLGEFGWKQFLGRNLEISSL